MLNPQETAAAAPIDPLTAKHRRRRPPDKAEQERRVAWGNQWGPMVRDATKHLRGNA